MPRNARMQDLSGCAFGNLVAVTYLPRKGDRRGGWVCRCQCGKKTLAATANLLAGRSRSCGCGRHAPAHNRAELGGERFGRLTVVARSSKWTAAKSALWECRCECGGNAETTTTKLRSGHTRSCGCLAVENIAKIATKHGLFSDGQRHELFDTYTHMVSRCSNPDDDHFANYGARGIAVCDRWRIGQGAKTGFELFIADMGQRPSAEHSLDREDNDGPYNPDNCRWATAKQQARNRRSNYLVPCDGEMVALSEFCERRNLRFEIINQRICRGWSLKRSISQPLRGGGSLLC